MALIQLVKEKGIYVRILEKNFRSSFCVLSNVQFFEFVIISCGYSFVIDDDIVWSNLKIIYDIFWICLKKEYFDERDIKFDFVNIDKYMVGMLIKNS